MIAWKGTRWLRSWTILAWSGLLGAAPAAAQLPGGIDIGSLLQQAQGGGAGGGAAGGAAGGGAAAGGAAALGAGGSREMISVSADIVEISGSIQTQAGFGWTQQVEWAKRKRPERSR